MFHSEADLQHAFAWSAQEIDPTLQIRLETRPVPGLRLDLLVAAADGSRCTAVELKYLTANWLGEYNGERLELKNQGAQDIRAYDVVKDLTRVERVVAERPGWSGLVLVLTNDPSYWNKPALIRETNAQAFRLYQGNTLTGARAWGPLTGAGTKRGREADLNLRQEYTCAWVDYTALPGLRGTFRLLILEVAAED
ncbi:hypothetical protein GCM10009687_06450 [Asanoa iriomotensis]|uniref:DUF4143 domain-containing protein n=1 Tax=Asanoa iriomotensis TaxID=234613 RepID=A0ABQ4C2N8_9ACTN|nr:hypothetical protein Air01nite_27910 [Asanoa iriomotensis]